MLSADATGNVTYYLYGLGPIGELTTAWAYSLSDGGNTPRQLVNAAGEVTLTSSYTPWGDTLEVYGSGSFTQGYFGGVMDAATGLIYVGNGQYYDPETGRFLTRNARPNQNNPYTPIDPTGAMLAPLALLALVFGRKKSRGKWDTLVILLVLGVSLSLGLAACGGGSVSVSNENSTATVAATWTPIPQTQNYQLEITATTDQGIITATAILKPTETPVPCPPVASGTYDQVLKSYGATFDGATIDHKWPEAFKAYVVLAVQTVAARLGAELGICETAAFLKVFGEIRFTWGCANCSAWAISHGTYIEFVDLYSDEDRSVRFVIHELGHVFDQRVCMAQTGLPTCDNDPVRNGYLRTRLKLHMSDPNKNEYLKRNDYGNQENGYHGFAGRQEQWQFAVQSIESAGEIWADMFLGWTFNNLGAFRQDYMKDEVPHYLEIITSKSD